MLNKGGSIERLIINTMARAIIEDWLVYTSEFESVLVCAHCKLAQTKYLSQHQDDCIVLVAQEYLANRQLHIKLPIPKGTDDPVLLD